MKYANPFKSSTQAKGGGSSVGLVELPKPSIQEEVFYRIALVPGTIANCAVEEIVVQGEKVVRRGIISDRDNRLGAEARLLALMSRRNGTSR
jgi:hypothetical protein